LGTFFKIWGEPQGGTIFGSHTEVGAQGGAIYGENLGDKWGKKYRGATKGF